MIDEDFGLQELGAMGFRKKTLKGSRPSRFYDRLPTKNERSAWRLPKSQPRSSLTSSSNDCSILPNL
jgi:hypothetical protein